MGPAAALRLALDPPGILEAQDITPDPWQRDLLASSGKQVLLNCSRQSGKSTVVSALALHTAIFQPGSLTLLLCPAQRQSGELFRKVMHAYNAMKRPLAQEYECSFEALEGLVFPDFEQRCGTISVAPPGKKVGGIDFGFRNPFAALWGVLTNDEVLSSRRGRRPVASKLRPTSAPACWRRPSLLAPFTGLSAQRCRPAVDGGWTRADN